jgi:NADP-dependent 3-hydroxy acid dehydrogenase YdfG
MGYVRPSKTKTEKFMQPLKPIYQQVTVIVGASSVIGQRTALRFSRAGAKVVVAARKQTGLNSLMTKIHRVGGDALAVVADIGDLEQAQMIAERAIEHYGQIDTWVYLSANGILAPLEAAAEQDLAVETMLAGQIHSAIVALPYLKAQERGALIHISPSELSRSQSMQTAYESYKQGVEKFLNFLRLELESEQSSVSVTNITPIVLDATHYAQIESTIGLRRNRLCTHDQPGQIASAVLHCAEHRTQAFGVGLLENISRISTSYRESSYF